MASPSFPLPPPTQEKFTRWFQKSVPNTDEIIVYPGEKLPCSTRSRALKNKIEPKHVFITQTAQGGFKHRLLGEDEQFTTLPKRLYSVCFPKIHVSNVPKNNRVSLAILDTRTLTLPYIPDEFYAQKVAKAERHMAPERRTKRRRTQPPRASNPDYRGWNALRTSYQVNAPNKYEIMRRVRTIIDKLDAQNIVPHNPFASGDVDDLTSIVQFVYHYCRGELRMSNVTYDPTQIADDMWQVMVNKLTDISSE